MKGWRLFIIASILAALTPLYHAESLSVSEDEHVFPGWPSTLQGSKLEQMPLTKREKHFANAFPGKVGLFSDGHRQYILRWVTRPTRRLHPAMNCFRASGYEIRYLPLYLDSNQKAWSAFEANRNDQVLYVRERIYDYADNNYSDVSAWYWSAISGRTKGPWWVVTTIERKSD